MPNGDSMIATKEFVKKTRGRWRAETVRRYLWYLEHLNRWLHENRIKEVDQYVLENWLYDNQWAPATRHLAVSALRAYFRSTSDSV